MWLSIYISIVNNLCTLLHWFFPCWWEVDELCVFAEYRILGKKGEGTFSEVLKCQHVKDGTYYACKKMKQHYDGLDFCFPFSKVDYIHLCCCFIQTHHHFLGGILSSERGSRMKSCSIKTYWVCSSYYSPSLPFSTAVQHCGFEHLFGELSLPKPPCSDWSGFVMGNIQVVLILYIHRHVFDCSFKHYSHKNIDCALHCAICHGSSIRDVMRLNGTWGKKQVWRPMFELEVFWKQMCCLEENICDTVGTFWPLCSHSVPPKVMWHPQSDSVPGNCASLIMPLSSISIDFMVVFTLLFNFLLWRLLITITTFLFK